MILLAHRLLNIAATALIFTLVVLSSFGLLVLAQDSSSLKISIIPQTDYAVAGQPFTYTVIVTNAGQSAVGRPVLFTETPTGTTFVATQLPDDWLVGSPRVGATGFLAWNSDQPVAPGKVVSFTLVVTVLPEMGDRPLASQPFTIISESDRQFFVTSLPITVPVLARPPTPTPSPTPTIPNTPSPVPIASSTPTPQPRPTALDPAPSTPTATSATDVTPSPTVSTATATPLPSTPSPATASALRPVGTIVITVLVLGSIAIGLVWIFKRR